MRRPPLRDSAKRGERLRAGDAVPLGGSSPRPPAEAGRRRAARHEGPAPRPVPVGAQVR